VSIKLSKISWGFVLLLCLPSLSQAISIDLNNFFPDPTVTVTPDGSSAFFVEDPGFAEVTLSNDPGLGDPEIIIASQGMGLFFDYEFFEAPGEENSFFGFVLNGNIGSSVGPAYEYFADTSSSGSVSIDLTPLVGTQLGLAFSLQSGIGDTGFNSTLLISNVRLDPIVVPIPSALVQMVLGLGLLVSSRYWRRASSTTALHG